jgi:hypothetical protein
MTTNRLAAPSADRITAPKDEAERQRFWIDRGNALLAEQGRDTLHWVCLNGFYKIEPR